MSTSQNKIGIMTFHRANNYGAVLQNFALQQTIKALGHLPVTIDYRSDAVENVYRISVIPKDTNSWKHFCIRLFGNVLNLRKEKKRIRAFEQFRRQQLEISRSVTENERRNVESQYDVFVCGSDQVWNENIYAKEDIAAYTLGFIQNAPKAAYGASAGSVHNMSDEAMQYIRQLDAITVREATLGRYLENVLRIHAPEVCDPVFLIQRELWTTFLKDIPRRHKQTLFLYYVDSHEDEACEVAKYIAKERKLNIIYPVRRSQKNLLLGKCTNEQGPLEFVADIAHADYVVASSFHAVAFSIIFHKRFVVLLHEQTGDRVLDLLDKLELRNRIITGLEDYKLRHDELEKIDYAKADPILDSWRNDSMEELNKLCNL